MPLWILLDLVCPPCHPDGVLSGLVEGRPSCHPSSPVIRGPGPIRLIEGLCSCRALSGREEDPLWSGEDCPEIDRDGIDCRVVLP